jgi:hypothetical protein
MHFIHTRTKYMLFMRNNLSLWVAVKVRCWERGGLEGLWVREVVSVIDDVSRGGSVVRHGGVVVESEQGGVVEGYEVGIVGWFSRSYVPVSIEGKRRRKERIWREST